MYLMYVGDHQLRLTMSPPYDLDRADDDSRLLDLIAATLHALPNATDP